MREFIGGLFFAIALFIYVWCGCAWAGFVISFWEMLAGFAGGGLCALGGWLCGYERG